jgi:hypothetical protein
MSCTRDIPPITAIPVITRYFSLGRVTYETRTTVMRRELVPAAAFEVPAGFKRLSADGPD